MTVLYQQYDKLINYNNRFCTCGTICLHQLLDSETFTQFQNRQFN